MFYLKRKYFGREDRTLAVFSRVWAYGRRRARVNLGFKVTACVCLYFCLCVRVSVNAFVFMRVLSYANVSLYFCVSVRVLLACVPLCHWRFVRDLFLFGDASSSERGMNMRWVRSREQLGLYGFCVLHFLPLPRSHDPRGRGRAGGHIRTARPLLSPSLSLSSLVLPSFLPPLSLSQLLLSFVITSSPSSLLLFLLSSPLSFVVGIVTISVRAADS